MDHRELFDQQVTGGRACPNGSHWRHVKTGKTVVVLNVVTVEADLSLAVVYSEDAFLWWSRPFSEFTDGRFVRLPDPEAAD